MVLIKLLIFTLTFYQLFLDSYAGHCPQGHRVKRTQRGDTCEPCPNGNYQPEENTSLECKACTQCEESTGSVITQPCTKTSDAICKCRGGFTPWPGHTSTCKCDIGFGKQDGGCSKCKDGHFNDRVNSPCRQWRKCTSGVLREGTRTSDVVCKSNSAAHTTHSPPISRQSEKIHATTAAASSTTFPATSPTTFPATTEQNTNKSLPTSLIVFLIVLGIVGLHLLTAVTCRLYICPRAQAKPAVQKQDVLFRNPVEESGDSSQTCISNVNPEKP